MSIEQQLKSKLYTSQVKDNILKYTHKIFPKDGKRVLYSWLAYQTIRAGALTYGATITINNLYKDIQGIDITITLPNQNRTHLPQIDWETAVDQFKINKVAVKKIKEILPSKKQDEFYKQNE